MMPLYIHQVWVGAVMFDLLTGERPEEVRRSTCGEVVDSVIIIDILHAAQPRQLQ